MEVNQKSNGNAYVMVDGGDNPESTPLQLTGSSLPIAETQLEKHNESPFQTDLIFPVESIPPWYITLIYAFQQILSSLSGPVGVSIIISSLVCGQNDHVFQAELIGTSVFMSGLCTLLQVTFGLRLPVIQASSATYLPLINSLVSTPQWRCPASIQGNGTMISDENVGWNSSIATAIESSTNEALWKPRMREVSGALIVASTIQFLLGCTGLVGVLVRFIGPLTVAPTVSLVGLSMHQVISGYCSQHWGISISTAAVFILVSQLLKNVQIPFPACNRSRGFYAVRYPVFRLFPPIFAIAFGWIICFILTVTGQLTDQPGELGYNARTDTKTEHIVQNKWFFFPYPGMWGFPTFSASVLLGMLAATVSTTVESIGDYYATARTCGVPPPPRHAVNRGIAMEGFGSIICGLLGAAHATTSYSETVGFIPLTGMGSRLTWQVAGVLLMAAGVFGKFGAILATIPDPVLGGILIVSIGMVVSVGLSNIQFVDLSGGRNLMILGTSLLVGITVPSWILVNATHINTGNSQVDQMLMIVLGTPMFVGGFIGCLLDNTMPGTLAERGMASFYKTASLVESDERDEVDSSSSNNDRKSVFDLPCVKWCRIRDHSIFTYLPFLPCYKTRSINIKKHFRCCRNEKETRI